MTREGISIPVLLGGAALTRAYVEEECAESYGGGRVAYARDAFDGLALMDRVKSGGFDDYIAALAAKRGPSRRRRLGTPTDAAPIVDKDAARARRTRLAEGVPVPNPPFWGPRLIEHVDPRALVPYVNERSLFQFQWGFRKAGRSLEEFLAWARAELRPVFRRMLDTVIVEDILRPQAVYGYWKAASEGNDLIVFARDGETELTRFSLPRQAREDGECIADFFRDVDAGERDVVGFQVVTVGPRASEAAREWFEANRYQDYLYLHGLGVEMAEALAEFTHKRIRSELGFAAEDAREISAMLSQEYRGSRYSFGYPACPLLEDQQAIFQLLGAERIGVSLSDEFQIEPEQSTSALVVLHPKAKYFGV
jgi:5-methyltetrahydrofolate--homocysteine methyltransferase